MFDNGAIFEIIMLICFGLSWPVTIINTIKTKTVKGVTPLFYYLLLVGYVAGVIYKIFYHYDYVLIFYILNLLMVLIQVILYHYYNYKEVRQEPPHWL